MFSGTPNYDKLTTNLKLSISRLKFLEKKKTEQTLKARRDIAEYMRNKKMEGARIRVEHMIREDYLVESMEVVEMYCDLVLARMGVLKTNKGVAGGMEEAISSLIWVTLRLQADVPELVKVHKQLARKFGKEFCKSCEKNSLSNVNEKLVNKLSINTPPSILVEKYISEIAKSFNIPYTAPPQEKAEDADMVYENFPRESVTLDNRPLPRAQNGNGYPNNNIPPFPGYHVDTPPSNNGGGGYGGGGGYSVGFDDITKRFNDLKKK